MKIPRRITKSLIRIKQYWFLIALILSGLASIFYMIVYDVSPFDKYREVKAQRRRVAFHDANGEALLERGYFKQARVEFQMALDLQPTDREAMDGRYLSDLFLDSGKTGWNQAAGLVTQLHLAATATNDGLDKKFYPVMEKYLGDVSDYIDDYEEADRHYQEALRANPIYMDALFTYAWFVYDELWKLPDDKRDVPIAKMKNSFEKMIQVDKFDYRGFDGLGYTLYIQGIRSPDPGARRELLNEAERQSRRASKLGHKQLNALMDFGEIIRSIDPTTALEFHKKAEQLLDPRKLEEIPENRDDLSVVLLTGDQRGREIRMNDDAERGAWVYYQLALDHLARCETMQHNRLLAKARSLDAEKKIFLIYGDQLRILRLMNSNASCPAILERPNSPALQASSN